jgi:hypothetical protein
MKYYKYFTPLFISLVLFSFNSCKSLKEIETRNLLIELRTTGCSGTCPVFTLQIFSNGDVILDGRKFIEQIGRHSAKINNEDLNKIVNLFNDINFFDLKDSYKSLQMDLPAKYITYYKNGESKEIMAYDNIPKNLTILINELKKLVDSLDWKQIK